MKSFFSALVQRNSTVLSVIAGAMLVSCFGITVLLFLNEQYANDRVALLKQIDDAGRDFSNGLMHLTLSEEQDGVWQRKVGFALLNQSLLAFKKVAAEFKYDAELQQLPATIDALSNRLTILSLYKESVGFRMRHGAYELIREADRLEAVLTGQLLERRARETVWFSLALMSCLLILMILGATLLFSERQRYILKTNLRTSEQRFLQLLQHTDEVFWVEDYQQRRLKYVSPAFERTAGMPCDAVLERGDAWSKLIHAEDIAKVLKARGLAKTEAQDLECRVIRQDGKIRWISGRIFPIWVDQEQKHSKLPDYIAAIVRDTTDTREVARQLQQAQKMEALGQLTGGVTHDFNNLLTVILSNGQLLVQELRQQPRLARFANLILRAAERGAGLNQQLRVFSSSQQLQPQVVNIRTLTQEVVDMLSRTLGQRIDLSLVMHTEELWCEIDPNQLQNALINLCINSRDAMPQGGRIVISVNHAGIDSLYGVKGPAVHITVKTVVLVFPRKISIMCLNRFLPLSHRKKEPGLA